MKALVLRDDFQKQLDTTNSEITDLLNQVKQLEVKREQLRGAVFALNTLIKLESEVQQQTPQEISTEEKPKKK